MNTKRYNELLDLYNRYLDIIRVQPQSKGEASAIIQESKAVAKMITRCSRRLGIE
jgi:hypothetical protein